MTHDDLIRRIVTLYAQYDPAIPPEAGNNETATARYYRLIGAQEALGKVGVELFRAHMNLAKDAPTDLDKFNEYWTSVQKKIIDEAKTARSAATQRVIENMRRSAGENAPPPSTNTPPSDPPSAPTAASAQIETRFSTGS